MPRKADLLFVSPDIHDEDKTFSNYVFSTHGLRSVTIIVGMCSLNLGEFCPESCAEWCSYCPSHPAGYMDSHGTGYLPTQ